MSETEARRVLDETLLRWGVDEATTAEVVQDAAVAVSQGDGTPWLLALACLPPTAAAKDIEDAVEGMTDDVAVPFLPRGNPAAVVAAAMAMVRRCSASHLAERDLVRWPHTAIGHERSDELEPLVSLDDSYDIAELYGDSVSSVDEKVRSEVERLINRHPQL